MAREEVGKQRIHIDLVGATNMGTTMAKPMGKKMADKSKPKSKVSKQATKAKNVDKAKKAAALEKKKGGGLDLKPKKKP